MNRDTLSGPLQPDVDCGEVATVSIVAPASEVAAVSTPFGACGVPGDWSELLVEAVISMPVDAGERVAIAFLLDAVGRAVPGLQVAAKLKIDGDLRVIGAEVGDWRAGGRVFPGRSHERALAFGNGSNEVTIHIGFDDACVEDDTSAVVLFARRVGSVFPNLRARVAEIDRVAALTDRLTTQGEQLVFAEKLASIGQIAAGIVHELNNPLTAIIAYTDLLLKHASERSEERPEDAERLRRIAESAHRMQRLTRNLVTYARPSSQTSQPVVLSSMVEQAISFCAHLIDPSRVTVQRDLGDGVLPVRGIPDQIIQVLVNLLSNASHAMGDRHGCIVLRTSIDAAEDYAYVTVEDEGHGVPVELLPKIFSPFFTTKREGDGTGLGLVIVKQIVEAHGGSVRVESEAGRGTRFIVGLPVASGPSSRSFAPT